MRKFGYAFQETRLQGLYMYVNGADDDPVERMASLLDATTPLLCHVLSRGVDNLPKGWLHSVSFGSPTTAPMDNCKDHPSEETPFSTLTPQKLQGNYLPKDTTRQVSDCKRFN
ncbi:uncharacterized protein LOC115343752 [Aquila chrysaetos chrysaetos]|uniref:uncharacterized protein LOC115343752 n=1 Tax=Aquila chrysaetos chrysaetos TaxID=223781 RepID=UPI001B7D3C3B|nr:uncharacterized protein LOC115343752 [Aquila chrysaetos chrysaetos]